MSSKKLHSESKGEAKTSTIGDKIRESLKSSKEGKEEKKTEPEADLLAFYNAKLAPDDERSITDIFASAVAFDGFEPKEFRRLWFTKLKEAGLSAEEMRQTNLFIIVLYANRGTSISGFRSRMSVKGKTILDTILKLGIVQGKPTDKTILTISRIASIFVLDVINYLSTPREGVFPGRIISALEYPGLIRGHMTPHAPSTFPRTGSTTLVTVYMQWQEKFHHVVNTKTKLEWDAPKQMTFVEAMMSSDFVPAAVRAENIRKLISSHEFVGRVLPWCAVWYPYEEVVGYLAGKFSVSAGNFELARATVLAMTEDTIDLAVMRDTIPQKMKANWESQVSMVRPIV